MGKNGLLVSNIPYYSGSRKALKLSLELLQNLPLTYKKETITEYLSRVIKIYENESISKLNANEELLFIYLSVITVTRKVLVQKQVYSESEIREWIKSFSGKRIVLNSILFASIPNKNVYRIKKFKTKIKIKRLSMKELNFCIEEIASNKNGFLSVIREFATFVNGDFAHILGIPLLEVNNIFQSINSAVSVTNQIEKLKTNYI